MSRGRASFKETDLTRALRAVTKAGLTVYGVQLKDGEINLILQEPGAVAAEKTPLQQWREGKTRKKLVL